MAYCLFTDSSDLNMNSRGYLLFLCHLVFCHISFGASVPEDHHYETIVLGMGPSGTAAATTLAAAGRRVLALEAQDRIGGRVRTVPFGNGVVELGAEWIHGQYPSPVYHLATQNNVTVVSQGMNFITYRSDGSLGDEKLFTDLIEKHLEFADEVTKEAEPMGQYITRKMTKYISEMKPDLLKDQDFIHELFELLELMANNYEAANSWNDLTTGSTYINLDGDQYVSWQRNGYKTLFEILLNRYNGGKGYPNLDIQLNKEVTEIIWSEEGKPVEVKCKDDTTYTAENVIVTFSLGVLKERHSNLFTPKLPEGKVMAIERIPMGVVDKIQLSYDHSWWPKDVSSFIFFWTGADKKAIPDEDSWTTEIFGASVPKGSDNVLTLWMSGNVAKMVETIPKDEVQKKATELVERFLGKQYKVTKPTAMIRSTWYTNPFTRGSYSYDSQQLSQYPESRGILGQPLVDSTGKPRLLFAGEATNINHFSTVHGAVETGYREATRLLPVTVA